MKNFRKFEKIAIQCIVLPPFVQPAAGEFIEKGRVLTPEELIT